jgi:hypothetical protein
MKSHFPSKINKSFGKKNSEILYKYITMRKSKSTGITTVCVPKGITVDFVVVHKVHLNMTKLTLQRYGLPTSHHKFSKNL